MRGELVLIVEDNEQNLKLARDVLEFNGFRTIEARRADDAIELALRYTPDVILMDIQLPDMDGVAALSRLRAEPRTRSTPVIAVTAFGMTTDREQLLDAGFDDYILKPIDIRSFPDRVRRARKSVGEHG
jgi:two-component system cell cycle response regulator DivK